MDMETYVETARSLGDDDYDIALGVFRTIADGCWDVGELAFTGGGFASAALVNEYDLDEDAVSEALRDAMDEFS